MRLIDLSPECYEIAKDGFPTGVWSLKFVCPVCGPPYTICINIGAERDESTARWAASPMPDGISSDWLHRVTISPSINNSRPGHGRRRSCSFHGNIIDGWVTP